MHFILFLAAFLVSCVTTVRHDVTTGLREGVIYKKDMRICIDGQCAEGVMVGPRKEEYKFKVTSHGTFDLFTFSTCHREETSEDYRKKWWGKYNREASGVFRPVRGVEDEYCPVHIGAYDRGGQHSWGFVDFVTTDATLPAKLSCGGDMGTLSGVSVCQSKTGLIQLIEFDRPVELFFNSGECKIDVPEDGMKWIFSMPRGDCVKVFFDADDNLHRLTLLGYDQIIVRDGK